MLGEWIFGLCTGDSLTPWELVRLWISCECRFMGCLYKSTSDISTATQLTTCAFQLSYGKLYNLFPIKWVFLIALAIFELRSLVCGAAPNSTGLIMGRVVAGIGSGGIFSGVSLTGGCMQVGALLI